MTFLLDTHGHYDFLPAESRADFLATLYRQGVRVVAQTVLPSEFVALKADLKKQAAEVRSSESRGPSSCKDAGSSEANGQAMWMPCPHGAETPTPEAGARLALPLPSLGFHPWYIGADADEQLEIFAQAVRHTRLIGEIGLDFFPRRFKTVDQECQEDVFVSILDAVAAAARTGTSARAAVVVDQDLPYVLSIHAVRSVGRVLDIYEGHPIAQTNTVLVIHWFTGSSDELTRLLRVGGYVSINPKMLESKRGRAYIQQVPAERLLLETDLPADTVGTRTAGAITGTAEANPAAGAEKTIGEQAWADESGRAEALALARALKGTLSAINELRGMDVTHQIFTNQARLYGQAWLDSQEGG